MEDFDLSHAFSLLHSFLVFSHFPQENIRESILEIFLHICIPREQKFVFAENKNILCI